MAKELPKEIPVIGDPIDHNLTLMFETYPALNNHAPSSWFVYKDNGELKSHLNGPCHAKMHTDGLGWDDLITAVPKSDPVSIAYIRMLIHGPFKSFSDLIALKNRPFKEIDMAKDKEISSDKYYLHLTSLEDWPANVLYNFCIATRVPIEHQNLLKAWADGVKLGYHPTLAFLLSYSTDGEKFKVARKFPFKGHYWHDTSSNWASIIKGDMVKMSKPYKTNPSTCLPSNVIWDHDPKINQLGGMSAEAISAHFGLPIEPPAADPPKPAARPKKKAFYGFDPPHHLVEAGAAEPLIQAIGLHPGNWGVQPQVVAAPAGFQWLGPDIPAEPVAGGEMIFAQNAQVGWQAIPAEPQPDIHPFNDEEWGPDNNDEEDDINDDF